MKIKRIFFSLIVGVLAFAASGVIAVAQRETATGVEVEKNLASGNLISQKL